VPTTQALWVNQQKDIIHSKFKWHFGALTAKDLDPERRAPRKKKQPSTLFLKAYPASGLSQSVMNAIAA
jgi:hypothetical protein